MFCAVVQLFCTHASTTSAAEQLGNRAAPSGACPSWCFRPVNRIWACETLECGPCQEKCLAVKQPDKQMARRPELIPEKSPLASTWTCAPVWPPQRMFVLFTMARSASTTACGIINTLSNSHCAYELLNPTHANSASATAAMLRDPVNYLKDQFESAFVPVGAAPCMWGFKLFPAHSRDSTFHDWLWGQLNAAIILERQNGENLVCHTDAPWRLCPRLSHNTSPSVDTQMLLLYRHVWCCGMFAVWARTQSLLRAKASGCWVSGGRCPSLEVKVSQQQVEEQRHQGVEWYKALNEHAGQHPRVRTGQLTTEG